MSLNMLPESNKDYRIVLHLTKTQYDKAVEYQESYELLFNKRLSLEDLFKISLFFSSNIDKQKIGTIRKYESYETKTSTNRTTKKSPIAKENTKDQQAKLGGF